MTEAEQQPKESIEEAIRRAMELVREEQFEEALELFERHLAAVDSGSIRQKRLAAKAFSFYGLCVAKVRRRYAEAVQCCQISLKHDALEPEHHHNLALIWLERGDRRRAVEALNSGLRLDPRNRRINQLWNRIGRRGRPMIRFLPRNNPLNVWLGKKLRSRNRSS